MSGKNNDLKLILKIGSYNTSNGVVNEFDIKAGEIKTFSQNIYFDYEDFCWVDLFVKAKDTNEWSADLIEIKF